MNYESIKRLAKQLGCKVQDLVAEALQNDPFYMGMPYQVKQAEWFGNLYHAYWHMLPPTDRYIRGFHYVLASIPGIAMPDGTPYENTDECFLMLTTAAKPARYHKLVPMDAFDDRRNDKPEVFVQEEDPEPELTIDEELFLSEIELYSFPDRPHYDLDEYPVNQRYHLEIWCEKSSFNDSIFIPLCQRYDMVLQTGDGELSLTNTYQLSKRRQSYDKPVRIFYISDYDPGGTSMPLAVSRKLEWLIHDVGEDVDVRLFPLALTAEQIRQYNLPRKPIKVTEKRKDTWQAIHGVDAVEINALNALHPGELRRIVETAILRYYDVDLGRDTRLARSEFVEHLEALQQSIYSEFPELQMLRNEYDALVDEFGPRLQALNDGIKHTWRDINRRLEEELPDFEEYLEYNPIPECKFANELGDGLYNSKRSYLEQLAVYKKFQGKRIIV
jgi:hypothetical protein